MRRILISALGAGKAGENRSYRTAKYNIEGTEYEESFIGVALTKHFNIDKNIILGTDRSIWEEYYRVYSTHQEVKFNEDFYFDLVGSIDEGQIVSKHLNEIQEKLDNKHKPLLLKYGLDDIELMFNFDILMGIMEELEDGDKLYVDITHSFRSLSLYMFVILNYLQGVTHKKINISYISYGMFEGQKNGVTPVINLNLIYDAIKWIKAASDLKKFGNSGNMNTLIEDEAPMISKKMRNFTGALNMSYLSALKKQLEQLEKLKGNLDQLDGFAKYILPDVVDDFLDRFKGYLKEDKEHLFQLQVAKYFYDKEMYSNAYLIMHESILTYLIECHEELKDGYSNKDLRDALKKIIYWKSLPREYKSDKEYIEMCKIFRSITDIRNTVAHGMDGRENALIDINNFINKYDRLSNIYKKRSFDLIDYINKL